MTENNPASPQPGTQTPGLQIPELPTALAIKPDHRLWDKLEIEDNLWYYRFHRFMLMGPARDIRELYNDEIEEKRKAACKRSGTVYAPPRTKKQAPQEWYYEAKKCCWEERAEAWDQHLQSESRKIVWWRHLEFINIQWEIGQKLRERILDMLKMPIVRTEQTRDDETGRTTIIVKPAGWDLADATRLIDSMRDCFKGATGTEGTPTTNVNMNVGQVSGASFGGGDPQPSLSGYSWLKEFFPERAQPVTATQLSNNGNGVASGGAGGVNESSGKDAGNGDVPKM